MSKLKKIRVTRVRSIAGTSEYQRKVMVGMGLKPRIGSCVELADTVANRGMVIKVQHLVSVEMI